MSWKGIKKGIARLPAMLMESSGRLEETQDAEYDYLLKRFSEFETSAQQLHKDATNYRDAVSSLMEHQQGFAETLLSLYQSAASVGHMNGGSSTQYTMPSESEKNASSVEAIETTEKYAEIMRTTRNAIQPELEILTSTVINPILELNSVIKAIHKLTEKRERKRLDYDRHRSSVKSLTQKQERSINDEKKLRQAELATNEATEVFNTINNTLKQDLPKLLQMRGKFIVPCFISFYQLQLKISSMLDQQLQPLCGLRHIDYSSSAADGYARRKEQVDEILEQLRAIAPQAITVSRSASRVKPSPSVKPESPITPTGTVYNEKQAFANRLNAQYPEDNGGMANAPSAAPNRSTMAAAAAASTTNTSAPLPPRIVHSPANEQYVVAIYPFTGEAAGDLSFKTGDRIRVVNRTDNTNDWWTGSVHGKTGIFPANYVKEENVTADVNGRHSPAALSSPASPPPEYTVEDTTNNTNTPTAATAATATAAATVTPTAPMAMPSPSIPGTIASTSNDNSNIATALFDFNGEQAGDLTFKAGDKIEIIRRTEDPSGWWMGSLNGKRGTFPGNYVKI